MSHIFPYFPYPNFDSNRHNFSSNFTKVPEIFTSTLLLTPEFIGTRI